MKKLVLILMALVLVAGGVAMAKEGKGKAKKSEKTTKAEKAESKEEQVGESIATEESGKEAKQNDGNKKKSHIKGEKGDESAGAEDSQQDKKVKDQRYLSVDRQLGQEKSKHATRVAKLEKMKELASGDEKQMARINSLMEKETKRFESKVRKLEQRKIDMSAEDEGGAVEKVKSEVKETKKEKTKESKSESKSASEAESEE